MLDFEEYPSEYKYDDIELQYNKILRLAPSNYSRIGDEVEIYGITFHEKISSPKVFVFETDVILMHHYIESINFTYKNIKYTLNKSYIRRNDDILVIECQDFKMSY